MQETADGNLEGEYRPQLQCAHEIDAHALNWLHFGMTPLKIKTLWKIILFSKKFELLFLIIDNNLKRISRKLGRSENSGQYAREQRPQNLKHGLKFLSSP